MNFGRGLGVLSVTAAVISSLVGVAPVPVAESATELTSAFIVELAPGETPLDVSSAIAEDLNTDIQIDETFDTLLDGFSAELTPTEVEALQASPDVLAVYPDLPMSTNATQTNAPWNLSRLDQDRAPADTTYTYPDSAGSGARIYIVDTGVSANPAQFGSRLLPGFSAISDGIGTADCNGHGTHVAGTVASTTYGVAKRASIVPVRVFGCTGSALTASVIAGLDWIAANHPAGTPGIVNLSLGSADPVTTTTDPLTTAVNAMSDRGFVMVVAAGNRTANACTYSPARAAKALTVGATTSTDARSGFSNFGACVDLFAPGSSIESLRWNSPSGSAVMSGTSMAAPHVAGVAALFWAKSRAAGQSRAAREIEAQISSDAVLGWVADVEEGSPNRLANVEPGAATAGGTFTSLPTPVISGTPQVGAQLSATTASWAPGPVNLTLQWLRNGTPIPGATGATYTFPLSDVGTQLTVRATGENLPGFVPQSRTSAAVVLSGISSAPLNLAATPAQRSASLSWTAPATSNGGTITDYVVQFRAGSAGSWITFADGVGTSTTTTVTGLLASTPYQFQVAAITSFGTSPMVSVSSTTPAAPAPPAPPAPAPAPAPVASPAFRFWSDTYQSHFYTLSVAERNFVDAAYPDNVWKYEGPVFGAFASPVAGSIPVYRFWSSSYNAHFYTASEEEKNHVIDAYPDNVWQYESIAYHAYPGARTGVDTQPMARFWSPTYVNHFFTASVEEAASVRRNFAPRIWTFEGNVFHVPTAYSPPPPRP